VVEMFSYLLQEKYFNWNIIKEKLNFYEVVCKMRNITDEIPFYERSMINSYLNKISKNTNLNHEYLIDTFPGLAVIFNWVKAMFKIYLYKLQNNLINKTVEKINKEDEGITDMFPSYKFLNLNKIDTLKSNEKFNRNIISSMKGNKESRNSNKPVKDISDNLEIKSEEYKKTHETERIEKDNQIYLTSIMSRNNENVITSNTNFFYKTNGTRKRDELTKSNNEEKLKTHVKEKEIKIELNVVENRRQTMINNFHNLPLIHVRTFHQLREYFNPNFGKKNEKSSKSPIDLQKFSLKNPSNFEKMLRVLQKGNIGNLNRVTVLQFCKNIDEQKRLAKEESRKKK
jgi:hypothetical protein